MEHAGSVGGVERVEQLQADRGPPRPGPGRRCRGPGGQVRRLDQLHDDQDAAGLRDHVVDDDDVLVPEPGRRPRLAEVRRRKPLHLGAGNPPV